MQYIEIQSFISKLLTTHYSTNTTRQLPQTTHPINSCSLTFHTHFLPLSQLRQLQFLAHIFILHWIDCSNQTVHWWWWTGCLVIKFWCNRDKKIHNTCLQNSGCHAKLLRRCGDLQPGFVEPCHNILRLVYHSVIWGTGSCTLALDRGDRSASHHLLCTPPPPTPKSNSGSSRP